MGMQVNVLLSFLYVDLLLSPKLNNQQLMFIKLFFIKIASVDLMSILFYYRYLPIYIVSNLVLQYSPIIKQPNLHDTPPAHCSITF